MATIQETFIEAYEEWVDPLFRYFAARLSDRERAKELTQETFTRAWSYIADGGEVRNMRAFLYTVASNLFKNELRARRPVVSLDKIMEEAHFEPADIGPLAPELADSKQALAKMNTLKPEYRDVLSLRYVDGLSVSEIAARLGDNASTVSVRLHRALHKLRRIYTHGA